MMMHLRSLVQLVALFASLSMSLARNPEPSTADTWKIKAGDTLIHIAENRYGSRAYAGFLKKFNKVDPRKLHVGKSLPTPDFSKAMEKCGATKAAPKVVPLLCAVAESYRSTAESIYAQRRTGRGLKDPQPFLPETLSELSKLRGQISKLLVAVDKSTLPDSLSKTLGDRFRKFDGLFAQMAAQDGKQRHNYYGTSHLGIDQIHRDFDSTFREMIKYARPSANDG